MLSSLVLLSLLSVGVFAHVKRDQPAASSNLNSSPCQGTLPFCFPATINTNWKVQNGVRFEGKCKFRVPKSIKANKKNFGLLFGKKIVKLKNWVLNQVSPSGNSGDLFMMKNKYDIHADNFEVVFQATVKDASVPSVHCLGDLSSYDDVVTTTASPPTTQPPTTQPQTTQLPLPYRFSATINTNWNVQNGVRFEGKCKFRVPKSIRANKKNFGLLFGKPIVTFKNWVLNQVSPSGDSGDLFMMKNKYDIHPDNFEVVFQATVKDTSVPTVHCLGDLPPYADQVTTTASPPTTQPPTTQSPTTQPPTNQPPTTQSPTTQPPTTQPPTTQPPTTQSSTTYPPTTQPPTTKSPTTQPPTTQPPTTHSPKTRSSTTHPPTTQLPTTQPPTYQPPTTQPPTTQPPTTQPPTTNPPTTQPPTTNPNSPYNYTDVIQKSIWFYRAQRSGDLPEVDNDPVPWRGDSALYDGNDVGVDLTGGWYDAGDWVKFNFPISAATAVLSWGIVQWKDGYQAAGQYDQALDSVKWSLDFFLKCWKPDQNILYGQVGNGNEDHSKMMRPEDMTPSNMWRPAYKVTSQGGGSDLAGTMVAAFAAGSIAFKDNNSSYSAQLLGAAESLYVFADTYRTKYTGEIGDANQFYPSSGYNDELVYAAAMLYKATKNQAYLTDAVNKYNQFGFGGQTSWAFDWSDKLMGAKLLLFEATGDSQYSNDVTAFLNEWRPGGQLPYTSGGLAYRGPWGALRYSANTAFIALMAADMGIEPTTNRNWALGQIHYMLGDNPRQSSYVVGFGNNPPKRPHHKSSTCDAPPAQCDWGVFSADMDNAFTLYGALVGGPSIDDNYVDDRTDYIMAEVTCDYNAGFQSAVAGLIHFGQ